MGRPKLSIAEMAKASLLQLRELAQKLRISQHSSLGKEDLLTAMAKELQADTKESALPPAVTIREGSTQVVFMPRDPQWAYVFWEISEQARQQVQAAGGQQLCLRLADITGLPLGATHPHTLQELVVDAGATEWHLPVPLCDRDYRVELGYRLSGGGWLSLALSSPARVLAVEPSNVVADVFAPFCLEAGPSHEVTESLPGGGVEHERFYQIATAGTSQTSRRVGSEVLHELAQTRRADQADQLHASGAGLWASGRSESGSGVLRQRSFWLVADAELIVYGATDASASLTIGEKQIPLDADGTFRVHVPFRDGQQLYPIRAVAADGEQQRSIRMEFERRTPEARVNTRDEAELNWF